MSCTKSELTKSIDLAQALYTYKRLQEKEKQSQNSLKSDESSEQPSYGERILGKCLSWLLPARAWLQERQQYFDDLNASLPDELKQVLS